MPALPALKTQADKMQRPFPALKPGYTVRVHQRVQEGDKERIQIFEGLIIAVHRGQVPTDASITVRRIASGIGVEKIFSLCSPLIDKIDVKKVAKVRRAKLNFLRGRSGKRARISERFTSSEEFGVATAPPAAPATEPAAEAPVSAPEAASEAPNAA